VTTVKNQWINLHHSNGVHPGNEFIVYSYDATLTNPDAHEIFDFFMDLGSLVAVP